MNRGNVIGLIVVAIIIAGMFTYIDFFAGSPLVQVPTATTTTPTASPTNLEITPATSTPPIVTTTGAITLKLNGKRKIDDVTITPLAVLEDSRCPSDVQCIQAGKVVVGVSILSPTRDSSIEMKPADTFFTSTSSVTLKDVLPTRTSGKKIQDNEYRFVFEVKTIATKPPVISGSCYIGGCSNEICSDQQGMASTCIYRAEYACYKNAKCQKQSNGQCGWTETSELKQCLKNG